jgi:ketosteroid isomerase-like protein
MKLDKLRTNEPSDNAWSWYQEYLDALDAYDLNRYAKFLADDVSVQFNNDEPLAGKDAAKAGLGQFWASITDMGYSLLHEPLNIYGSDSSFVLEALNHYARPAGNRITIRAAAFTDRGADGRATSVRLYQDVSALYADTS